MTESTSEIISVNIEDELRRSYLDYAMSVIVGRALPDVRDGLKPVHRRVLFAMHELKNDWNKPHKKSARVVGDVVGKYHPHGDTAVYDTLVRMAQPFSLRYTLVDGQGNFGSVDGDSPAAMRYTEVRMSRLAHELLADLEKDTVNFVPNYDETESIPDVMPTKVPNLLVNGSSGIAVGMATNIPPHNLSEVIDACIALMANPELTIDEIIEIIPGPDFPTCGIINGRAGIVQAYHTGRGRIYVRARASIEEDAKGKQTIIVHELPYQVNKANQIEKIAQLVKDKRLEGISALRDESDKDGMRIVIEIKRADSAEVVLNNLYTLTQFQTVFGINMVALDKSQPKLHNIKQILEAFVQHRRVVVTRRTIFDLEKASKRAHILEGLGVALSNIDEVIALIKKAANPQEAKQKLLAKPWAPGQVADMIERAGLDAVQVAHQSAEQGLIEGVYRLTQEQAQAILDLRLHKLTGLEQDKILREYDEILVTIRELRDILENISRLMEVIKEELLFIKEQFGDARQTEILASQLDLTVEDLITEETVVLTLSHYGYAKRQSLDTYKAQRRGGRGRAAANIKEEDVVEKILITNTHDHLLCFTNYGKVYWLKAYQFPEASPTARGKPINNLIQMAEGEKVSAVLAVKDFTQPGFVVLATQFGTIKKVSLKDFSRPRANGIIAIDLNENDCLIGAELTEGESDIMLFTNAGKAIRFAEANVRCMGRTAKGVRGIRIGETQQVVSLMVVNDEVDILTVTENGFGKRTSLSEYRRIGRGGQGVISIQVSERNGQVIGAVSVICEDQIMLISNRGTLVRTRVVEISRVGRNTQGVKLINVTTKDEKLVSLAHIDEIELDDGEAVQEDTQD
jgi:DNA gyrase subunit A